jgi:hypothetical protein
MFLSIIFRPILTSTYTDLPQSIYSNINMQFTHVLGVAACLALSHALPTQNLKRNSVDLTFHGATPEAVYTISVPLDAGPVATNNVLSISSVTSSYDVGKFCTLHTVDVPPALVEGPPGTWVVGPPQTVIDVSCKSGGGPTPPTPDVVSIEFDGADPVNGAKYTLSVPLDGSIVTTGKFFDLLCRLNCSDK